jgi:long-chain fatty acid transport protein
MRIGLLLIAMRASLFVFLPSTSWAQDIVSGQGDPLNLPLPLQFDFINPGARSLALGGTFIGLADDATSASTNPAGLTQLSRLEFSVEGRYRTVFTRFLAGGRLSGEITNVGIDTIDGPFFDETSENLGGLSFLSVVYPQPQWTIAGYRQEGARVRRNATINGVFLSGKGVLEGSDLRQIPSLAFVEANIVHYGSSFAVRVGKVSVGAGVSFSRLDYSARYQGFDFDATFPAFYETASFTSAPLFEEVQIGDDWGVGAVAGVMVYPTRKIQVGASYRRGARFDFNGAVRSGVNAPQPTPDSYAGKFTIPDVVGVGVALRPVERLTIVLDVDRVKYSALNDFVRAQIVFGPDERDLYAVTDATEIHVGGEYLITRGPRLPAVRVGFWNEGDHSVTYSGVGLLSGASDALAHDVRHYSVGGGVSFSRNVELNGGYEWSERANFISLSMIVRF